MALYFNHLSHSSLSKADNSYYKACKWIWLICFPLCIFRRYYGNLITKWEIDDSRRFWITCHNECLMRRMDLVGETIMLRCLKLRETGAILSKMWQKNISNELNNMSTPSIWSNKYLLNLFETASLLKKKFSIVFCNCGANILLILLNSKPLSRFIRSNLFFYYLDFSLSSRWQWFNRSHSRTNCNYSSTNCNCSKSFEGSYNK